jgi:hypothetical protein
LCCDAGNRECINNVYPAFIQNTNLNLAAYYMYVLVAVMPAAVAAKIIERKHTDTVPYPPPPREVSTVTAVFTRVIDRISPGRTQL